MTSWVYSPRQQPLHLPGKPRGPSPAHLRLADSSTRSGRLDTNSKPAAVYCGPRRAPGPSLHPPPGRMAALTAQMCEPGRGLPARSSAEGPSPGPRPRPLPASRSTTGASPARRAAQGVEWEKAEWEEQGGKRIPDPPRPSAAPTSPAAHPGIGHWHLPPSLDPTEGGPIPDL